MNLFTNNNRVTDVENKFMVTEEETWAVRWDKLGVWD